MTLTVNDAGNIFLYQGDTGSIVVEGLDTDKDYTYYFAICDKSRNQIGEELKVEANKESSITFELTSDFTDKLTVPTKSRYEIYYYGIKRCDPELMQEDTCVIGTGDIGSINTITVYPKKVEGI